MCLTASQVVSWYAFCFIDGVSLNVDIMLLTSHGCPSHMVSPGSYLILSWSLKSCMGLEFWKMHKSFKRVAENIQFWMTEKLVLKMDCTGHPILNDLKYTVRTELSF